MPKLISSKASANSGPSGSSNSSAASFIPLVKAWPAFKARDIKSSASGNCLLNLPIRLRFKWLRYRKGKEPPIKIRPNPINWFFMTVAPAKNPISDRNKAKRIKKPEDCFAFAWEIRLSSFIMPGAFIRM